jgi:MFS transporter, DHA1 family, multidrug resistance protein
MALYIRVNRATTINLLSASAAVLVAGHSLVAPSLPLYALSLGVDLSVVGFVVTSFGLGRLLMDIPTGWLGDRIGRRPFFILGISLVLISSLVAARFSDFAVLVAARFVQGAGSAVFSTTAFSAIIDLSTERDRARAMSTYHGALYFGAAFGPVIGGFIADRFGFQAPFVAMAATSFFTLIWIVLAMPETRRAAGAQTQEIGDGVAQRHQESWWTGLVALSLLNVVFMAVRSGAGSTGVPLVSNQRFGLSAGEIGQLLGLSIVLNLAFLGLASRILTTQTILRLLIVSTLIAASGMWLYAIAGDLAMFIAATVLFAAGTGLSVPIPPTYAAGRATVGSHGLNAGIFRTSVDLGQSLGPLAASVALAARGPELLFGVGGLLMISAAVAFVPLSGLRPRPRTRGSWGVSP